MVSRTIPNVTAESLLPALTEMGLDLRWSGNHSSDKIWRRLDEHLWDLTQKPWVLLQTVPDKPFATLPLILSFLGKLTTCSAASTRLRARRHGFRRHIGAGGERWRVSSG
jgi:hypothetical protein